MLISLLVGEYFLQFGVSFYRTMTTAVPGTVHMRLAPVSLSFETRFVCNRPTGCVAVIPKWKGKIAVCRGTLGTCLEGLKTSHTVTGL